jgi:DNA-binding transcriptional LysR family regulator
LASIQHVVCASPSYLKAKGCPKEPQELRAHNCVPNQFSGTREWPFRIAGRTLLIPIQGALSSNSYAVMIQLAQQGLGVIRVPGHAIRGELEQGALVQLLEPFVVSTEWATVYYSRGRKLPAKTLEFLNFIKAKMSTAKVREQA